MNKLIAGTSIALTLVVSMGFGPALARGEEPIGENMMQSANFIVPWKGMTGFDRRTFTSGQWSGKKASAKILKTAVGDLNGDKVDDGAAIYSVTRDNDTHYFLGAFVGKRGSAKQVSYVSIDSEANVGDLSISSGNVTVTLKHMSDSEQAPALKQTFEYTLEKGKKLKSISG